MITLHEDMLRQMEFQGPEISSGSAEADLAAVAFREETGNVEIRLAYEDGLPVIELVSIEGLQVEVLDEEGAPLDQDQAETLLYELIDDQPALVAFMTGVVEAPEDEGAGLPAL